MSWTASLLTYVSKRSLLLVVALSLAVTPALVGALARAADVTISVDGSTRYQRMDGFGVSVNSESWKGGQLKPALDMLVDQNGSSLFRVIVDMTDWEQTNDNADPFTYDWTYYDQVYSSPKFQDLWATIAYLNSKGVTSGIALTFMGRGPAWMAPPAGMASAMADEWVEMVSSAAYYARNTAHVQFGMFAPDNEADMANSIEGISMSGAVYADAMNRLAIRLDTIGLGDLRLLGPDTATPNIYWGEMSAYPALMAKVDHLTFHSYTGSTNGVDADIKASAPTKNFWMDEYSLFHDSFTLLSQGAAGLLMWDGYDSAYYHPLLHGASYTPPNDAGNGPALLAYDSTTGVYTPRKEFYQFSQLYKFVPAGSQRVSATSSNNGVATVSFQDPVSGRLTVVGENTSSRSLAVSVSLTNVPMPGAMQYFQTNGSDNLAAGAPVAVSGGNANVTVPGGTIFTLTGLPTDTADTVAPTVTLSAPADGSTIAGTQTVSASASDNVAVVGVQLRLDGTNLGSELTTSPYSTAWDTTTASNGTHTVTAVARDASGNTASSSVTVTVDNGTVVGGGTLLLGTKTVQGTADANPSGNAEGFAYTAAATGAAGTVSSYVDAGSAATTLRVGLYSDAGGRPGTLLASGTVTAPKAAAWNTAGLSPTPTLTAGVRYWIAFLGTGGQLAYRDTAAGSCSQSASGTLSALPATWTTGTTWASCNLSAYVSAAGPADTTAPSVPGGVTATATGFTGVSVTWSPSTDDVGVAGYHVWRGTQQVATTTSPSYADTGLTPGTTYGYTVTAFDAAGNESAASAPPASATTATDVTPPSAPTALTQTAATDTTATVSWTRSTDDVGVAGYRYFLGSSPTAAGTTTTPPATYTGLTCGQTYAVRVVPYDAAGNTSDAATGQVTTAACVAPTTLALDRQVTTHQTQKSTSITSGALTTTGRNELLVVFLTSDGPRSVGGVSFSSVTGGGLTWTLRKRVNARYGTSEIWTAAAVNGATGLTVRATRSNGSYLGSITVAAFKGASLTAVGALGGASATSGAASASVVAAKSGSLVWGVGNDWDHATARTVGSGQTMVDQYLGSDGDTFWVQSQTATTVAGQKATISDAAPSTDQWNLAVIEILPAS